MGRSGILDGLAQALANANSERDELVVFLSVMQAHAPTTLTTAPLGPLLDRLFEMADVSAEDASTVWDEFPAGQLDQLMRSKTEYAGFYGRLKDLPLAVSRETGRLLYMLARGCGARSIVEYGTSFGISTLHLAAALRDNGGGRLVATLKDTDGNPIGLLQDPS